MILGQNGCRFSFQQGETRFSFLPSGDIFEFTQGGVLINGFRGSPKEGSVNNIWLRIYGGHGIRSFPLLGIRSASLLSKGRDFLIYTGRAASVSYRVAFYAAAQGLWFWKVGLRGSGETVDVVYGQDLGVAQKGGVLSNELYTAQYLGHSVFQTANGFCICSRQNLPQAGRFPYVQQGMAAGRAVGYSTDGTQFFGLSYKLTDFPEALRHDLPNTNYQFEFSYAALQSEKMALRGESTVAFYSLFLPSHPSSAEKPEFVEEVQDRYLTLERKSEESAPCPAVRLRSAFGAPYASPEWREEDVRKFFPERRLVESDNGRMLSFFTEDHTHVVLQPKEAMVERPHGNIIEGPPDLRQVGGSLLASTNYMYGLFNGQTVVGNTSFHKFLSVPRGLLNNLKNSGQRIYLELDGRYRMLTMPAAYQVGANFSRWFYVLPQDTLVITVFTVSERPDLVLEVGSVSGNPRRFILTNQLVLGENEFTSPVELELCGPGGKILRFRPPEERRNGSPYPSLHYDMQFPNLQYTLSDDRIFFEDSRPRDGTFLCVATEPCGGFRCVIRGRLAEEEPSEAPDYSFKEERRVFRDGCEKLLCGFHLEKKGKNDPDLEALNETARWFGHCAMIHYSSPHGLEQTGGAAWGTRDVCQGPMEFFLATGNVSPARGILLTVFAHQDFETGEWPQWFMFDRYPLRAGDCHGDVVLWPLKAAGDYLAQTGDRSVLRETVPYAEGPGAPPRDDARTVLGHIRRAVGSLESRFLPGTSLLSYAGGDWDDTLQPADDGTKDRLVSSWTQALAYQVLKRLSLILRDSDPRFAARVEGLAERLRKAFSEFLIRDGVIPGFVLRRPDGSFTVLLHPHDRATGIHYRLLPMTRSIIAELAGKDQAQRNVRLIDEHLRFPDGVRTMDRPAPYRGGVSRFFRRAEQAANVGREVGLQYTHAHIRYLEAMAKVGEADRVWDGLFVVNPITVRRCVPNAAPRQSNLYFSSSDGMFPDRYRFASDFDKLRDGTVGVKGGWRLYSSGPGIYLHQLISNILGIRFLGNDLVIDPVLPARMDGLLFSFACWGRRFTFVYHIAEKRKGTIRVSCGGKEIPCTGLSNPYRAGGVRIGRKTMEEKTGEIHIELL